MSGYLDILNQRLDILYVDTEDKANVPIEDEVIVKEETVGNGNG